MLGERHPIAFDFDGTLVDSAAGILRGISLALDNNRVRPVVPLDRALIGPPLPVTLAKVAGGNDPELLDALIRDFIRFYDGGAFLDSTALAGCGELLAELHQRGHPLYLVTNKRGTPTRKIIDHLGWGALFAAVFCLDEHADCLGKTQLLAQVIQTHRLCASRTPYVGDTDGDAAAARTNAMPYIHVAWGYGGLLEPTPEWICTDASELLAVISSMTGPAP